MEAQKASTEDAKKVELAMNECRRLGLTDNPTIRFVSEAGTVKVDPCNLLTIDADEIVADELGVDVEKIAHLIEHRLDGRKARSGRVASIEVHPAHGIVVDADVYADVTQNDTREQLESDIVSISN